MNKGLEPRLFPLSLLEENSSPDYLKSENLIDLSKTEYEIQKNILESQKYLEKNLFWEKSKEKIYHYNKTKYRKKFVGQNYSGIFILENVSKKLLKNIKIILTIDKVKSGSKEKDILPLKEFAIKKLNSQNTIIFPFLLYLENASYQLNLKIFYFEFSENNLSELKKISFPIPLQPVNAINITSSYYINNSSEKTNCLFEINLNNVSEKDLIIKDLKIKLNKGNFNISEIEFILPDLKNIGLNFGESYSSIISLSKNLNMFDCKKNINFGFLEIYFSFLEQSNDEGMVEIALVKKPEENRFLKLIPVSKNFLKMKNKEINEFKCFLLNLSSKTLFLRFDKIFRENMAVNVHQINVEGKEKIPGIYEIKSNEFLKLDFLVFPRIKGFFRFNFFKVLYVEKRTYNVIEFDSPEISIF